jgi:SWI/SNF-related matrix-associated actin-dependent regulator of chromatin subfamily A member 5
MVNGDIEAIIANGEERTMELNTKYEALNLEDLSNFKSEASVQQWEGEDFRTGVSSFYLVVELVFTHLLCEAAQTAELQPSFPLKTRAESELLCRQLLQGYPSSRPNQDGEGSKVTSCSKADFHVRFFIVIHVYVKPANMLESRQDFQFFSPKLAQLQERELAVHKVGRITDRRLVD